MRQDKLDAWCQTVPGLERDKAGHWGAASIGQVSFPEDAHSDLATIEDQSYWFKHRNAVITSIVRRHPPDGTIFDIGGGNGFVSRGLVQSGYKSVVVEPGAIGVAVARQRGLRAIQASFEALDPPAASIPAIGLFDVLEHIGDADEALNIFERSLSPGGMIYIAVPAYGFLWSAQDVYGGHFRRYTLGKLSQDLRRAGFEPIFGTYFFAALVAPLLMLRTLPSLLKLRSGSDSASINAEHLLPSGSVGRVLAGSFAWELRRLREGRSVPAGTSCFIAARKPTAR